MRRVPTLLATAAVLGLAAACAHSPRMAADPTPVALGLPWPRCELPALNPSPGSVRPGDVLTLTAGPISCDRRTLPPGGTYTLTLFTSRGPVDLGAYPLAADMSFRAAVTVPPVEPETGAFIEIRGGPADLPCHDTGACLAYGVSVTILAG